MVTIERDGLDYVVHRDSVFGPMTYLIRYESLERLECEEDVDGIYYALEAFADLCERGVFNE